jgi:hypothetical protein
MLQLGTIWMMLDIDVTGSSSLGPVSILHRMHRSLRLIVQVIDSYGRLLKR